MPPPRSGKTRKPTTAPTTPTSAPLPPRYPNEQPLPERTAERDREALRLASLAFQALERRRNKARARKQLATTSSNDSELGHEGLIQQDRPAKDLPSELWDILQEDVQTVSDALPPASGDVPRIRLPLQSMYDGSADWPKMNVPVKGAKQPSFCNIGFPFDEQLVVKDFEEDTYIETQEASVVALARDILDLKSKSAKDIADAEEVETRSDHGRTIEHFRLHGRSVARVKFEDADAHKSTYNNLRVSKHLEEKIDRGIGQQPELEVEQWVAAHVLLCRAGQIGGRTDDYWKRARDLAQQQLFLDASLIEQVRRQITAGDHLEDAIFVLVLEIVKKCISRKSFNPYYQAQRDSYAVSQRLFYHIKDAELVIVLDKSNNVIAFQCSDAFRALLTKSIEHEVASAIETYSTLRPVPVPDMTRHGLHWVDWLVKHPELDFRDLRNDPKLAKSGVFHFGGRCQIGDPSGKKDPGWTKGYESRLDDVFHVSRQLTKLRYSAFGACTELVQFFFDLLEPKLLGQYRKVAREVGKLGDIPFETRRHDDPFVLRALLINLMTNEHKDKGDWHYGFAGLVCVGDFDGGDLLLRELGLRIESRAGCVQLLRGRELRHSITDWTGRRSVVVSVTHEAVHRWARRQMGEEVVTETPTMDSCLDAPLEDISPEQQAAEDEKERIPERHLDSDSAEEEEASEASMEETSMVHGPPSSKRRLTGSSDASTESIASKVE